MAEIQYAYETVGNTSYLVATFEGGVGVINYQLQMLANNDIKNLVRANKRQKNEDIQVFYNITSKIPLKQADSKSKITKAGLLNIIEGALTALTDIEEYQLVSSGILFDEEYVFIKPGSFEPSFIYVPCSTEDIGIESLKKLLLNLIMESKVEISSDNFIQVLLETLNSGILTIDTLKTLCSKYKSNVRPAGKQSAAPTVSQPPMPRPPKAQPPAPHLPTAPPAPGKPKGGETGKPEKPSKNNQTKKAVFLLFQIVLLGVIAILSVSGILQDESGNLNLQYLLGVALLAGGVDFVLYKELLNKNVEGKPKKENKPAGKSANKAAVSIPGKEMPKETLRPQKGPEQKVPQFASVGAAAASTPAAPTVLPAVEFLAMPMEDFESEDTVVLTAENNASAYLEFYENGLSKKIQLNKESVIVGKMSSLCDYSINNNKISKIHAEFVTRGTEHFVKDCNSTNGTFLNGEEQRIPCNTECPICNGDRIRLANVEMMFYS